MLVTNQKIKMKWNNSNKRHYESILDDAGNKKYFWTTNGDEFEVDIVDITKSSKVKIDVSCDYCGQTIKKYVYNYYIEREKSEVKKDCCSKCSGIKLREKYGTLDELLFNEKNEDLTGAYTKDFLTKEFYRYVNEFGKYPRLIDLKNTPGFPSATGYNKQWGNYNNFLKTINILGENGWYREDEVVFKKMYLKGVKVSEINSNLIVKRSIYEMTKKIEKLGLPYRELFIQRKYNKTTNIIDLLKEALVDLFNDIGKIPVSMDYDYYLKLNCLPSRNSLEKLTDKSFSEICNEIFGEVNKIVKSDEDLLKELFDLKDKLGRTPMAIELTKHGLAEMKTYTRRFNMTYSELIESFGWKLHSPKRKYKTKDELLNDFHDLYMKLGRVPSHEEIDLCEFTTSYNTYVKYFDSIYNILRILNIEIPNDQSISAGFVGKNKNNELCKSTKEIIISNVLLDNGINYKSEVKYSDLYDNTKNKYKMDWYLENYDVCVEYFGMYSENQLNRNTLVGRYSRKTKRKIIYCKENNIKLISLYKHDLENNCIGLINKFKEHGIHIVQTSKN